MIIEKIELENFLCYSGSNSISFKEGINVIIGDNGYGKSKLFDAFFWVMYDQIFVSEKKEFQFTKTVKSSLISDKAKSNTVEGKVTACVKITFKNIEKNFVYVLERKYAVHLKNGQLIENNDSEFTVMKKEQPYLASKVVTDEVEKNAIRDRIMPSNIKDYLWFQGEQVESIIDFNKQDTLTKAINVLSSITRYDQIKQLASATAKSANIEFNRELKRLSKDADLSEQFEKERDEVEKKIKDLLKDEIEIKDNLSRAESRCESLLNKLDDATKVNSLQQSKKGFLLQLDELNQRILQEQSSFHRKMFRNKWVLKGTSDIFHEFSQLFETYQSNKLNAISEAKARDVAENEVLKKLQSRLPIDVPEPIYIHRMLEKEHCLICDREAKKGSEAWNKINQLLERPNKKNSARSHSNSIHDFEGDYKKLYQNGLALSHRIEDIDEDIQDTLKTISSINTRIKEVSAELKKVDDEIIKLLSDTSLNLTNAEGILSEYSIQNKKVKDFTDEFSKLTHQLENAKDKLRSINDTLKSLVPGDLPKWLVEKRDILNDFELIANSTRDRVFTSLISQLEKEANKHYEAMTAGNKSSRGQIRLRRLPNGNYMPEIIDNNNIPLLGSNTSNLILVKLAAIMAIISAKSNSDLVNLYTLITDAPTSVFGEDYTIGFCKTISKVYRQSIIMSKEFYKNQNLRNELLSNPEIKLGLVYTITPTIKESERANRNTLETIIEPLN